MHRATRFEKRHIAKLEAAAHASGLPFSTWLRTLALAAAGISPLEDQLTKATARVQNMWRRRKRGAR